MDRGFNVKQEFIDLNKDAYSAQEELDFNSSDVGYH